MDRRTKKVEEFSNGATVGDLFRFAQEALKEFGPDLLVRVRTKGMTLNPDGPHIKQLTAEYWVHKPDLTKCLAHRGLCKGPCCEPQKGKTE